ncbi:MAG: DUF1732 domain-containing protein, partial [Limibacillus sp.]
RDVLFDIDWQGTQQLRESARDDLVSVFILPPSMASLEERLRSRAQDSEEVVQQRMAKADVREELDRLAGHIAALSDLLEAGGPVGRRLDFLCQELNREANTLCSKSADMDLTRLGLALKATIDQLREQVQNIE